MLKFVNWQKAAPSAWLPMVGSQGQGLPLVKLGDFAADMLRFESQQQTSLHTHPGNHILFVVAGEGVLIFESDRYQLIPGCCYLVPGSIPHQIIAGISGLILLSVSDKHNPVDSPDRLEILINE